MRLSRIAATVLGGLVLSASLAVPSAVAAVGSFIWEGPNGKLYSVQNPPDKKCLNMGQSAKAPRNRTGKPLTVYSGKKCTGKATHVAAGKDASRSEKFKSVAFNR